MKYQSLAPVSGTIINIRHQQGNCCSQQLSLASQDGQTIFILSPETLVLGNVRLRTGMRIIAYYDTSLPVPLIYPPQYQAQLIAVLRPGEQGYLGYFNRDLVSANQTLKLNIAPSTTISTVNGQAFDCPVAGHTLFVYYSNTTRSIPPQTTPRKIVILC